MKKTKSLLLSGPYILWMVIFTLVPLCVVLYYALTDVETGKFTLGNIMDLWLYVPAFARSIGYSFIASLICLLIGLAAGGITAGIMAGKNRSVRPQNSAASYVRSGSMQLSMSRDIFLYQHVTRTPRQQNNSGSGGGGSRSTRSGGF